MSHKRRRTDDSADEDVLLDDDDDDVEAAVAVSSQFVVPGALLTRDSKFLRGHGTFVANRRGALVSTLRGEAARHDMLLTVRAHRSRYAGEVGDVVVGRVREVGTTRWRVDVGAPLDAVLQLSSINLPGGLQRRRTADDAREMRSFFAEGDLISAEVHSVHGDGALQLHSRSLKYGKLARGGVVARVPPSSVRRAKSHFIDFPFGVSAIIGVNGFIYVHATADGAPDATARAAVARLHNATLALAAARLTVTEKSLLSVFRALTDYEPADMLKETVQFAITRGAVGM